MTACSTDKGICLLLFDNEGSFTGNSGFPEKHCGTTVSEGTCDHLEMLREQLEEYFRGIRKEFTVPLVPSGTSFQLAVWKELTNIRYGTTISYSGQSIALGKPGSVRAVARANSLNRIAIIIPCHRVIGSNGTLTGYAGGLDRKGWLLAHEKKHSGNVCDLSLF